MKCSIAKQRLLRFLLMAILLYEGPAPVKICSVNLTVLKANKNISFLSQKMNI